MTITDDIVKGLRNPTPLYAVAGTADLAAEKLREVPALLDRLRSTDPKDVQGRFATQAKDAQTRLATQAKDAQARLTTQARDAQSRLSETLSDFDLTVKVRELKDRPRPDLRKLGESVQSSVQNFALQGVGRAAEYAVRARETYDELAERGKGAVAQWRGEAADEVVEIAAKVEPEKPAATPATSAAEPAGTDKAAKPAAKPAAAKPAAKKSAPRRGSAPKKPAE
jgi:polyhydroxyalkanoate synthesis regulator phasin